MGGVPVDVAERRRTAGLSEFAGEPVLLRPRVALQIRRAAVVHLPAIGGPGESPAEGDPIIALAIGGVVVAARMLRRGRIDAAVDPRSTRRRAVVLEVGE